MNEFCQSEEKMFIIWWEH